MMKVWKYDGNPSLVGGGIGKFGRCSFLGEEGDWKTGKAGSLSSMVYKTPPSLPNLSKVCCDQKCPRLGMGKRNLRNEAVCVRTLS